MVSPLLLRLFENSGSYRVGQWFRPYSCACLKIQVLIEWKKPKNSNRISITDCNAATSNTNVIFLPSVSPRKAAGAAAEGNTNVIFLPSASPANCTTEQMRNFSFSIVL